jgi:hypothetical protein
MNPVLFSRFAESCGGGSFLGLHPWWYYYIRKNPGDCAFNNFTVLSKDRSSDIPLVLLAVVDDLLVIAGLVAVVFVIYGGIRFITSQGSPEETAKAQSTVLNAVSGLVIALLSVAVVSFIGNHFGG